MGFKRNKKILILLILIIGIGFATVATTLYITSTASISSNNNDFDVKFTKAIIDEKNISSTAISSNGRSITYTTEELGKINDESVLNYTIENNSSLYDADVSVECTAGDHSDLYRIDNNLSSTIQAGSSANGTVTVILTKTATEELTEEFTCTLTATAIERTSAVEINKKNKEIVQVLKYDEASGSSTFCVTGEEETCEEITTDKNSTYTPATIVKYNVKENTPKYFHVIKDNGNTLTLQQRENTVYNTSWNYDYEEYYKTGSFDITKGPAYVLSFLEDATKDWTNVNKFDYSIGDSSSTLGYSQCDSYSSCTGRTYGLTKTDVNVRILTIQELYEASGNKVIDRPHAYGGEMPLWAFNYLGNSISGGGTVNDTYTGYSVSNPNGGYWLMNSKDNSYIWFVNGNQGAAGILSYTTDVPSAYSGFGARAVVEINK